MLFLASFKLVGLCCSCVLHPLPCFASYRLVLNHTWLGIMSCSCVVCLPCCLLLLVSACSVAIVRIRSTTLGLSLWLRLGLVLIPSGISSKMTIAMDLITIIAMLVVLMISLCVVLPIFCCQPLIVAMKPLTFDTIPANRCMALLPLAQPLL